MRSGRRLRLLAIMAACLVVVVVAVGFVTRTLFAGATDASPDTGGTVEIALLEVPVTGTIPDVSDDTRTVWQGRPATDPQFDVGAFGRDLSFQPGTPTLADIAGLGGNVVFLGVTDGQAMILFADEAPIRNPWDYVYRYFTGHGDRRLLSATFECCAMTLDDEGNVYPQVQLLDLESGDVAIAQWLQVPSDTAVVALRVDDEPIGFQRPIGRVASFTLRRQPPYDATLVAYDASGNLLATSGPYLVEHVDLPPRTGR